MSKVSTKRAVAQTQDVRRSAVADVTTLPTAAAEPVKNIPLKGADRSNLVPKWRLAAERKWRRNSATRASMEAGWDQRLTSEIEHALAKLKAGQLSLDEMRRLSPLARRDMFGYLSSALA